jgi:hypothetical protein
MKKIFAGLFAMLLAAATVFAGNQPSNNAVDPLLHWFDDNNIYIGQATEATQRQVCDGTSPEVCMNGYEEIDTQGNPIGAPVPLFKEQ